jgi:hypothetical protein
VTDDTEAEAARVREALAAEAAALIARLAEAQVAADDDES